jgi:1-deoxy-D-xylulose-5-phosphate reductoisomerase
MEFARAWPNDPRGQACPCDNLGVSERTRRRVVILGSTGSIGRQALDVIRDTPDDFEVVGLAAGGQSEQLKRQADEFGVSRHGLGADTVLELATLEEADIVLNAVVGAAGLRASVAALAAGKRLALANKESLVAGGEVCLRSASQSGGTIVAVDSEHAALAQCLAGVDPITIRRLVLTASGGPFRTRMDLSSVTPEDALAHPTWSMGPKITIDSATLMNKGLEIIEAHFLFGLDYDRIDAVCHPQSLVHGMVEFVDSSTLLQAAPTDMRVPIQSALTWPDRRPRVGKAIDWADVGAIEFEAIDLDRFPCVNLARRAGEMGGTHPAALNASNEEAVGAFLNHRVAFVDIPVVIEKVLGEHESLDAQDLEAVLEVDAWARRRAADHIDGVRMKTR